MINPRTAPINLPSDAGPIKFRRELARRIAAEGGEAQPAAERLITSAVT
jgi:hypothetical protein